MTAINNTTCAFIPKHLEIENRPELQVFPNRVVYMSHKRDDNNKLITAFSFYEPVLDTLDQSTDRWEMRYENGTRYENDLKKDCWLSISYFPDKKIYSASKYIRGELKVVAGGCDWKSFFMHLTMTGIQEGERCNLLGHERHKMNS